MFIFSCISEQCRAEERQKVGYIARRWGWKWILYVNAECQVWLAMIWHFAYGESLCYCDRSSVVLVFIHVQCLFLFWNRLSLCRWRMLSLSFLRQDGVFVCFMTQSKVWLNWNSSFIWSVIHPTSVGIFERFTEDFNYKILGIKWADHCFSWWFYHLCF